MVIFDCEKMKCPNTGLYRFCESLGNSLMEKIRTEPDMTLAFYTPKSVAGAFGDTERYYIYRSLHKYFFPFRPVKNTVWHSTQQFPKAIPYRIPLVLTVHDLNFLYEENMDTHGRWLGKLQKNIDRAERIVAISEFTKAEILRHLKTDGKHIDVIYNGCTVYYGKSETPDYVPERPFLFTVGTILRKKNFHVLPCLLDGNDMELVISGLRYPYENEIMEAAKWWKVADRVHITGPVSEAEKDWYMRNCRAFVFPSLAEGFGLPVIEAMTYGKPVFLSRRTSLPEIGGDKAFYFNDEFDPDGMKKEFYEGIALYDSGAVSKEDIIAHAKRFSWDNAAGQYVQIYKSLL